MKVIRSILVGVAISALAACTNMSPKQQGTMSGAAIGAAAGAGIAAIAGGSAWTGAAIGGVAGGVAGNIRGVNLCQAPPALPSPARRALAVRAGFSFPRLPDRPDYLAPCFSRQARYFA